MPDERDTPIFSVDIAFLWLTNNSYLEEIGGVIKKPLENPLHKQFLRKLEDIKQLAVEAELIFNKKDAAQAVCSFISDYEQLLRSMYQYQILINDMSNYSKNCNATLEQSQEIVGEPIQRDILLTAYDSIKKSYESIIQCHAMEHLKKQIKL